MGELLALLALVLFSINIIITKLATSLLNIHLGFLISVGVNVLFSAFLFLIQLLFFQDEAFVWSITGMMLFIGAGLFSTYLGRWFFFETIEMIGPTRASTFQVSNPLFTTIIAWIFMDEALGGADLVAITIILLGLFLVSYIPNRAVRSEIAATSQSFGAASKTLFPWKSILHSGILLAFLSSLSYAIGNVIRGAAIQNWNQPILGGMLGALLGLILHAATHRDARDFWQQLKGSSSKGILLYVFSGVLTISAQISVIASMHYIPISIANLITMSTPIIVTPLSFLMFKNQEGVTYRTIVGIILVLGGISSILL